MSPEASEPRSWVFRHSFASRALQLAPVFVVVLFGGVFLAVGQDADPFAPFLFLPIAALQWWFFARFPTCIEWQPDDRLQFVGLGMRVELKASEIESIQPGQQVGFFTLRYRGGKKLRLLAQFDDFHEFLVRVKVASPCVELRGC